MKAMGKRLAVIAAGVVLGLQAQEDPLSTFSSRQQFLNNLQLQQERNSRSLSQSEREILYLENRIAGQEAEALRQRHELSAMPPLSAPPGAGQQAQEEARRQAETVLERARIDQARTEADLARRQASREQLARDRERLRQLESEYRNDPSLADELLRDLPPAD